MSGDLRKFEDAPAGRRRRHRGLLPGVPPRRLRRRAARSTSGSASTATSTSGGASSCATRARATPPRRAVAVDGLPLVRHEHRGWTSLPDDERDRQCKRNFYRIIDRFGSRRDLLVSRRGLGHRSTPDGRPVGRRRRPSPAASSSARSASARAKSRAGARRRRARRRAPSTSAGIGVAGLGRRPSRRPRRGRGPGRGPRRHRGPASAARRRAGRRAGSRGRRPARVGRSRSSSMAADEPVVERAARRRTAARPGVRRDRSDVDGAAPPPCPATPSRRPSGRSPAGAGAQRRRARPTARPPAAARAPRSPARSDASAAAGRRDRRVRVVELARVARRQRQVAEGERVDAALDELGHALEVAGRLRHLPAGHQQVLAVDPVARRRSADERRRTGRSRPRGGGRRCRCRRCGCRTRSPR